MEKNIHAVALGRLGGLSRSPAKVAASRRNQVLTGRRKRFENWAPPNTVFRTPSPKPPKD